MFIKNILPLIIAPFLGWITNYIAIRMLFRPYNPPRFRFLRWMQGVIPSRRDLIAQKIGKTIEKQLFTKEDMNVILSNIDVKGEIEEAVSDIIDRELDKVLIPIPISWNAAIKQKVMETIEKDIYKITEESIPTMLEDVDIGEVVKNRISQFTNEELEEIVTKVADRELKHIVWLGGLIGLVIGIIQTIINFSL